MDSTTTVLMADKHRLVFCGLWSIVTRLYGRQWIMSMLPWKNGHYFSIVEIKDKNMVSSAGVKTVSTSMTSHSNLLKQHTCTKLIASISTFCYISNSCYINYLHFIIVIMGTMAHEIEIVTVVFPHCNTNTYTRTEAKSNAKVTFPTYCLFLYALVGKKN